MMKIFASFPHGMDAHALSNILCFDHSILEQHFTYTIILDWISLFLVCEQSISIDQLLILHQILIHNLFIHSFIPDIYIAPLQETYSEALSVQLRSKRNVLRSLQIEDMLF